MATALALLPVAVDLRHLGSAEDQAMLAVDQAVLAVLRARAAEAEDERPGRWPLVPLLLLLCFQAQTEAERADSAVYLIRGGKIQAR